MAVAGKLRSSVMAAPGETIHAEDPAARFRLVDWACITAAVAVLIGFRLHAFDLPLETDECNYAYIARRLLMQFVLDR